MNVIGIITVTAIAVAIGVLVKLKFFPKKKEQLDPSDYPGYPKPNEEEEGIPLPDNPKVPKK